jgi:hypothetical protein
MAESDNRTMPEVVIQLHDIAREMESKDPLTKDAFEIRRIADRISHLENLEREERYKHVHDFTPHKLPPIYIGGDCED